MSFQTTLPQKDTNAGFRKPWLIANQYGMLFVISQDNEIIIDPKACEIIGMEDLKQIVNSVK